MLILFILHVCAFIATPWLLINHMNVHFFYLFRANHCVLNPGAFLAGKSLGATSLGASPPGGAPPKHPQAMQGLGVLGCQKCACTFNYKVSGFGGSWVPGRLKVQGGAWQSDGVSSSPIRLRWPTAAWATRRTPPACPPPLALTCIAIQVAGYTVDDSMHGNSTRRPTSVLQL